jgi:hypothetical protein
MYVNDLIIPGTMMDEITRFKEEMKQHFKIANLGLEVQQNSNGIRLCQAHYAVWILEATGMADRNSTQT